MEKERPRDMVKSGSGEFRETLRGFASEKVFGSKEKTKESIWTDTKPQKFRYVILEGLTEGGAVAVLAGLTIGAVYETLVYGGSSLYLAAGAVFCFAAIALMFNAWKENVQRVRRLERDWKERRKELKSL